MFPLFTGRWVWADLLRRRDPPGPQPDNVLPIQPDPLPKLSTSVGSVHDLRRVAIRPPRGHAKGTRRLADVTGICLHQTAAMLATAERFLGVPAHGAIPLDASAVLLHPVTDYMYHAHKLNRASIGIEIACRAAGIEGNMKTVWVSRREKARGKKPRDVVWEPKHDQLFAARALCRYYVEEVARQGGQLKYIWAHRNGHSSRVSDPGSLLWETVGLWCVKELGLEPGPVMGSGKLIPQAWGGVRGVRYNWRVKGFDRHVVDPDADTAPIDIT